MTISPYLIGQNAWWQGPQQSESWGSSVWTLIGSAGVATVRIGGHGYDTDMPGWTSNEYAVFLMWIDQIHAIGAEPIVQVSRYMVDPTTQKIVPGDSTTLASNAATLVAMVNAPTRKPVQFWSIGNEPNLPGNYPVGGTDDDSVSVSVANYVKAVSKAMRAVYPSIPIKIYAPDAAWFDQPKYNAWLGLRSDLPDADITGLDLTTGLYYIDGLSFHRYPFGSSPNDPAWSRDQVIGSELRSAFPQTLQTFLVLLNEANSNRARTGGPPLTWGLTEFNMCSFNPSANGPADLGVNSFLNGQLFAEYFGQGIQNNATFFTPWSIDERGDPNGLTDHGFLGGDAINSDPTTLKRRSTYYHMQILSNLKGSFVPSESRQVNVSAISTMTDTQVNVLVLNEDTVPHTCVLRLDGKIVGGGDAPIGVAAGIPQQYSHTIPDQTSILLVFDLQGNLTNGLSYSLLNYEQNQSPQVFPSFNQFLLETGTPITQADAAANYVFAVGDYNLDGIADLYCLKHSNTSSNHLEVNILNGLGFYQSFLLEAATPITQADATADYVFAVGRTNRFSNTLPDLYCLKRSHTFSETLEVTVLVGGSGYKLLASQPNPPSTPLALADVANYMFAVGHSTLNVNPDLYCLKYSHTSSNRLEVSILNGADNLHSFSIQGVVTPLVLAGDSYAFAVGDYDHDNIADLYCIKLSHTNSNNVEVSILNGADNFQSFLLQSVITPITLADAANYVFAVGDYNRDGVADLYCLKHSNTGTSSLEVHILNLARMI